VGTLASNATGDANANIIAGNSAANVLTGGGGTDTVSYAAAATAVIVNLTTGTATGGGGADTLVGFTNIIGSNLNDTLTGDSGANTIDGGGGTDTMTYAGSSAVSVSLTTGTNTGGDAAGDVLVSIENVTGSAGNDTIEGSGGNNVLNGGSGGNDTLSYANAAGPTGITISLALVTAQVTGGSGTDTVTGFDNLIGSAFADKLTGDGNANLIIGGAGNDTINGGIGNDTISGGLGHDALTGGAGSDIFVYTDADFGSTASDATLHSDTVTDYGAGDKIDLTGLISLVDEGADLNNVLHVVTGPSGHYLVQIDQNAVLQNLTPAGFTQILDVTSTTNIVFTLNDHDWTYNISTHTLS
jgi:Ca2+-binding RTX toxin-like protein